MEYILTKKVAITNFIAVYCTNRLFFVQSRLIVNQDIVQKVSFPRWVYIMVIIWEFGKGVIKC